MATIGQSLEATLDSGAAVIHTVNAVEKHTVAGDRYGQAPKNGEFAVCDVTLRVTSGSYDYNELDWSFQTTDGTTYASEAGNSLFSDYGPALESGTLPAGGLKRGNVVFDVPRVHGGKVIIYDVAGIELGYWTVP